MGPVVVPRARKFSDLQCQTTLTAPIGAKDVFLNCKKSVDRVGFPIVLADERVEIDDIAFKTPADHATEQSKRLEWRIPDAVIVKCDLPISRKIECLIHAPDVGAEHLPAAVAGAIGQQNDVAPRAAGLRAHAGPLQRIRRAARKRGRYPGRRHPQRWGSAPLTPSR